MEPRRKLSEKSFAVRPAHTDGQLVKDLVGDDDFVLNAPGEGDVESAARRGAPTKRTKVSGAAPSSSVETSSRTEDKLQGHDFGFPYAQPYPSQLELMRAVYQTIDRGGIGVFESPTGTGKSLSLICAALTWIRRARERAHLIHSSSSHHDTDDEPAWIREAGDHTDAIDRVSDAAPRYMGEAFTPGTIRLSGTGRSEGIGEKIGNRSARSFSQPADIGVPPVSTPSTVNFIFLEDDFGDKELDEVWAPIPSSQRPQHFRILYCSRTHSQLSQFIGEVQRTRFVEEKPPVATSVLGSRKLMCIHPEVRRLRSATAVNDRCHELRVKQVTLQSGVQQASCPFYDGERIRHLAKSMHERVYDLEDLTELGERLHACPYYAARASFEAAELVVMPYQTLLHETTRASANVRVDERTVVILDEAHNLVDALNDMYSIRISLSELFVMQTSLEHFWKAHQRWKPDPERTFYLEQLQRVLKALIQVIDKLPSNTALVSTLAQPRVAAANIAATVADQSDGATGDADDTDDMDVQELCQSPSDFLFQTGIENVNFASVLAYLYRSRCIHMLQSKHESLRRIEQSPQVGLRNPPTPSRHDAEKAGANAASLESSPVGFFDLANLLAVLSEPHAHGRVLTAPKRHVRYLLLDPATYFSPIYRQARATILAGGTLEPREALLPRLFDQATCQRIHFRSFPHVVPPNHILALFIGRGPRSVAFDFSYSHRHQVEQIDELGRCLLNVCTVVPAGLVVFFPSYAFENSVWSRFHETNMAASIAKRKEVFREKRRGDTEALLDAYRRAVTTTTESAVTSQGQSGPHGALLSAIIGGRLSEGINFADDLGRCVIVVGLPFPNARQTETRLHVQFLRERQHQANLGSEYVENACMIAVNQTVGRVIRHAGDYAAILFVDQRYEQQPQLRRKLSRWLRGCVQQPSNFGAAFQSLAQFFRERRRVSPRVNENSS